MVFKSKLIYASDHKNVTEYFRDYY